jgi:predicted dehydrogenase
MNMGHRMVLVGTGGWGEWWCRDFLPPNMADGVVEVVAAVDIDPASLENAKKHLGLTAAACFTDVEQAFAQAGADCCAIGGPASFPRTGGRLRAAPRDAILSEKPIADTLEGAVRIADKVRRAGVKMGVTMSHRFDMDKTSLREELRSGRNGRLDYLSCRYSTDLRRAGCWGFRHEMDHPLLLEGARCTISTCSLTWRGLRSRPCLPRPGIRPGATSRTMRRDWFR